MGCLGRLPRTSRISCLAFRPRFGVLEQDWALQEDNAETANLDTNVPSSTVRAEASVLTFEHYAV
jgi:hypothetical protein